MFLLCFIGDRMKCLSCGTEFDPDDFDDDLDHAECLDCYFGLGDEERKA